MTDEQILAEARFHFDVDAIGWTQVLAFARALQSHLTSSAAESNDRQIDAAGEAGEPVYQVRRKGATLWMDIPTERTYITYMDEGYDARIVYLATLPTQPAEGGETVEALHALPWLDKSAVDPIEKARRVLKHLVEPDAVYFFQDGFPRHNEIASQATCVLAVLNTLASPAAVVLDDERAAFEAVIERISGRFFQGGELVSHWANPNEYQSASTQMAWLVWQARANIGGRK